MILGDYIGQGGHRVVFAHKTNPEWVVKIAKNNTYYNIAEFEAWRLAKAQGLDKWLVPCVDILEGGKYLIQERGEDITRDEIPTGPMPLFLQVDYTAERQWKRHKGLIKKM